MFRHRVDDHIELRLLAHGDAAALYALTDANRAHLRRWLPWLDTVRSPSDSLDFIRTTLEQFADNRAFTAAIVYDGTIAGMIGHHGISWANRSTSLGWWLAASHEGRGIMTRSCRAVVGHAFDELRMNRIEIRCATENTRSRAIPERLGFRLEGVLRETEWLYDRYLDLAVYAMLRRDWPGDSAGGAGA